MRLQPGASKNEVVGRQEGVWRIRLTAPPVEGRANRALIEFLAKKLDVARSRITLLRGETSREKLLAVEGLDEATVQARLESA